MSSAEAKLSPTQTCKANAAITAYRAVKLIANSGSKDLLVDVPSAGDHCFGIAMEGAASGREDLPVACVPGTICFMEVDGNAVDIATDDPLTVDAAGLGVKNTVDKTPIIARALEPWTSATNGIIRVMIEKGDDSV